MTRTILLALTLALAPAALASPAYACGGTVAVDPDVSAVQEAVRRYAANYVYVHTRNTVYGVRVEGDRAVAFVRLESGERAFVREVRLARRANGWRVTRIGPRRDAA